MIVFKEISQFDVNTGEKLKSVRVPDYYICDFTGEKIQDHPESNTYEVDYGSNDPCFGDGPNEGWLLDDFGRYCHHELFSQRWYVFQTSYDGREPFERIFQTYLNEVGEPPYSLDGLLRWSRGRMLERVIKEGKYEINDFLEEIIPEDEEG